MCFPPKRSDLGRWDNILEWGEMGETGGNLALDRSSIYNSQKMFFKTKIKKVRHNYFFVFACLFASFLFLYAQI